jgi:hypothetical protein
VDPVDRFSDILTMSIFFSSGSCRPVHVMGPSMVGLYTWEDSIGKREIHWTCGEKKDVKNDLSQVCFTLDYRRRLVKNVKIISSSFKSELMILLACFHVRVVNVDFLLPIALGLNPVRKICCCLVNLYVLRFCYSCSSMCLI